LLVPNVSNDGTWYAKSSVVITAWRVLRLLMARRPPDFDRGLECKKYFHVRCLESLTVILTAVWWAPHAGRGTTSVRVLKKLNDAVVKKQYQLKFQVALLLWKLE
jgi:hypothetical protein